MPVLSEGVLGNVLHLVMVYPAVQVSMQEVLAVVYRGSNRAVVYVAGGPVFSRPCFIGACIKLLHTFADR